MRKVSADGLPPGDEPLSRELRFRTLRHGAFSGALAGGLLGALLGALFGTVIVTLGLMAEEAKRARRRGERPGAAAP